MLPESFCIVRCEQNNPFAFFGVTPTIPPSSRADVQSRATTSKNGETTRECLYNGAPPTLNMSQPSNNYYATLASTITSSYSNASKMSLAALI